MYRGSPPRIAPSLASSLAPSLAPNLAANRAAHGRGLASTIHIVAPGLVAAITTFIPISAHAWPVPVRPADASGPPLAQTETATPPATTTPPAGSAPATHPAPPAPAAPVGPAAAAPATHPASHHHPAAGVPPLGTTPGATQPAPPTPTVPVGPAAAAPTVAEEEAADTSEVPVALGFHGAMEFYYAYNFNKPSNDITNWRWYDHRHNQLGLQGLWFAPEYLVGPVSGHFQLQLGVLAELFWPSERSIEEDLLWRLLQEATMEWKTPWKRLSIEGGIFNVPFGPEWNLASKNWNWSTSNLFALMPYQISGARFNLDLGRGWITRIGIYNGWDRIVKDNNRQKAMMFALEWTDPDDEENYFVGNYMVGNERDTDDDRGRAPRHTFDVYGQWHAAKPLFVRLWTFSGFERRPGAVDGWLGLAAFVRVDPLWWFSITGRGDYVYTKAKTENLFHSDVLADPAASTALGSGTLTLDFHPHSNVSLRIEGRYDNATFPLFYKGNVPISDPMDPRSFVPNANRQATVLAGMTTWF